MTVTFIYFGTRLIAAIVGFLAIALYTRLVGPEGYGIFTLVLSAVTTGFALLYQWLRTGLLRFLPGQDQLASAPAAAAAIGYAWTSAAACAIALVLWLWPGLALPNRYILLGLACTLALSAMEVLLTVAQSRRRHRLYAGLTIARALGALAVAGALAWAGYGAVGLLIGFLAAHAVPVMAVTAWHWRHLVALPFAEASLRGMLVFGWPMAIIGVAGGIVGLSDRYMIAWLLGTAEAGIYAAPYDLVQRALNMLMLSAFLAFSPLVFNYFDRNQQAEVDDVLKKQSALMLLSSMPVAVLLAVNGPLVAKIFFGDAFRPGAIMLMPWIAAAGLIQGWVTYYLSYGYTLTQNLLPNAAVVTAGALLNVLLNLLLIPALGILGAAIATLATYVILFLSSLLLVRRWFALPWPVPDALMLLLLLALVGPLFIAIQDTRPLPLALAYGAGITAALAAAMLIMNVAQCRRIFAPLTYLRRARSP